MRLSPNSLVIGAIVGVAITLGVQAAQVHPSAETVGARLTLGIVPAHLDSAHQPAMSLDEPVTAGLPPEFLTRIGTSLRVWHRIVPNGDGTQHDEFLFIQDASEAPIH